MGSAADRSLAELIGALAERTPSPAAGSAAAWCGALAAALLEMTASLAEAQEAVGRAASLRAELLDTAEAEMRAYAPVLSALALPPDDPSRADQLEQALALASEPPLAIAHATAEVAELSASVAAASKPAIQADAVAAVLLAEAAARVATGLIENNLRGREDHPLRIEAVRLGDRAAQARTQVLGR